MAAAARDMVRGGDHGLASDPLMRATGIHKLFDGTEVLHGVDLALRPGEVHALVGQNGAGKSTIINLLSGRLQPDGGEIEMNGVPVAFRNPLAARRAGISVIAQELELVATLSIAENIFLGAEPTWHGLIRWAEARRRTLAVLRELGVEAGPDRVVGTISIADQQLVEIAKAIIGQFRVLIMDEPTSALNLADTRRLFKIVRRLRADGAAILYVSHRLWEVFDLADRVTVLRDGSCVSTSKITQTDVNTVIRAMLGAKSSLVGRSTRPRWNTEGVRSGTPALELQAIRSGQVLSDIDLHVRPGEVIGLAGVNGSGRLELAEAIYGLRRIDAGIVRLNGAPVALREPLEALAHRVSLLPEDRKLEGIFGRLDVRENVILDCNPTAKEALEVAHRGAGAEDHAPRRPSAMLARIHRSAELRAFNAIRMSLGIECSGPKDRITALSGGNQQKVLFARAALTRARVMLLCEPTRGVDVGAKEEIYSVIDTFAARGIAIVVSSSELSELLRLAGRIYVLRGGRIAAEMRVEDASEDDILRLMAG